MHSIQTWLGLTIAASAAAAVPMFGDPLKRQLIYWLLIPTLLAGFAGLCCESGVL
jgi:hypothetical protein